MRASSNEEPGAMAKERHPPLKGSASRNGDESRQWFQSLEFVLEYILKHESPQKTALFLESLLTRLRKQGVSVPHTVSTAYMNTIGPEEEPQYQGDREIERRIKSYI